MTSLNAAPVTWMTSLNLIIIDFHMAAVDHHSGMEPTLAQAERALFAAFCMLSRQIKPRASSQCELNSIS